MKARLQRFFWVWVVDTFGWIGCSLPLIVLSVTMWASISGVTILEPMPDYGSRMDPVGPGYVVMVKP